MLQQKGSENAELSKTIASTATMRLASLPMLDLFYTPLEERFERITRIARRALDVPVAAITLMSAEKQWFKSANGWAVSELPKERSLCRFTLEQNALQVFPDTKADPRTSGHPLVVSPPRFRFYAGHPLTDQSGLVAGTFCVFDLKPRHLSEADRACLTDLAALAERELADEHLRSAHASLTAKLGVARREAMMDSLTRLWNRRGAATLCEAALQRADRTNIPLGLALFDLDDFKRINDTYGHQCGDEVLRRVAERLVSGLRTEDVACRLGGDEFLVLMAGADRDIAASVFESVRSAIGTRPIRTRDGAMPVSISGGFTVRMPGEDVSVDALINRADRALMDSKASLASAAGGRR